MSLRVQIQCINKTPRQDPNHSITHIGGNSDRVILGVWRTPLNEAIAKLERGDCEYFVMVGGAPVNVIVAESRSGSKYLRTVGDETAVNNLLSLPECPR